MKKINITDLINMDATCFDNELYEKIEANPKYQECQENYQKLINSLESRTKFDIDNAVTFMEVIAIDKAFNEGFKLAIRLILSSIE